MIAPLLLAAVVAAASPECAALAEDARPAIDHANGDWLRAMQAGDAASIAAAYAADGVFVLGDGTVAKGPAEVQAVFAGVPSASIAGGGIYSQGLACGDGGLVYEWGLGEIVARGPDGRETRRAAPYLTVWKKLDGGWKIIRNLGF
ncbi:YybH family protein [Phenylobacterium sp.]|uniref:YybH family protein n=1 Tax=Phenylobacterium sp. TaxID=1871053 RepID=UPI003919C3EC